MSESNLKNPTPIVLTIAGSDCSGGAGIQADLKVFQALRVYGAVAVTAVTVQNFQGVQRVYPIPAGVVAEQIEALFQDTMPSAVKTGMLTSEDVVRAVAETLQVHRVPNIVVDPAIRATSGMSLLSNGGVQTLKKQLIPLATLVTPNYAEASELTGKRIGSDDDAMEVGKRLLGMGCQAVVITGGHRKDRPVDLLMEQNGNIQWFEGKFGGPDLHGTGCVFSSAVTSYLALNYSLPDAIARSKRYIYRAISERLTWEGNLQALNLFLNDNDPNEEG
jgi:hydroxymethylpyrimidine kinase/phosphomethylpyrimidine kinase